jgi:hypothetical protein
MSLFYVEIVKLQLRHHNLGCLFSFIHLGGLRQISIFFPLGSNFFFSASGLVYVQVMSVSCNLCLSVVAYICIQYTDGVFS